MIVEIGSYRFPGFYQSIFCNSDEFIDDEEEAQFEIEELIESKDFEVTYEYDDFNKYMYDVCREYMSNYVDKLIEILPTDITDHEDFVFDIIPDTLIVDSPEYYNYRTDRCFCEVETNRKTLKLIKEYTLRLDGVNEYIIKNFTSYDGFVSFVSNDMEYWKSLDIEDYKENMLISLLDMLIALSDCTGFEDIKIGTYENIPKYCYASPVIYYREKDEKIAEKDLKILKSKKYEIKRL